ncbi:MFS transporter [Rhizobium paknamense]|uniref:MFS family arabinose efflux permease n=1 Tax=Rhizobium paknamense TaxID=1206817 RepID=A0ABU0IBT3_9HYPH|nr:MFS transporter [Rhizobium paknamense]MDQ0455687.1 putative MFS family arabinose efflux permease [Rhizobium paknamense]
MSAKEFHMTGAAALVIAHCAGMLDLVALPVWVGALVERFGFSPQQAGMMATLFLLGAVAASAFAAPLFARLNQKALAVLGFAVASATFLAASTQTSLTMLSLLHLVAGISVGIALSMVHGTMGHAANPHRLFAAAGMALGLFGIVLLAAIPQLLILRGGPVLFQVFAGVMAIAAISSALLFRNPPRQVEHARTPFSRATWYTIFGISIMTFNQSMVFSFVEVIGKARGFEPSNVLAVLIALGFVNFLVPAPLATFLQTRVSAPLMAQIGPGIQAVLAVIVTSATVFPLWAPAAAVFVAVQIFTHTFVFGLLAKLDPTGRAAAATPAMLMVGAALAPIIGGALGQNFGFAALGATAVAVSIVSIGFFTKAKAESTAFTPSLAS